jgi:hypothetical protein
MGGATIPVHTGLVAEDGGLIGASVGVGVGGGGVGVAVGGTDVAVALAEGDGDGVAVVAATVWTRVPPSSASSNPPASRPAANGAPDVANHESGGACLGLRWPKAGVTTMTSRTVSPAGIPKTADHFFTHSTSGANWSGKIRSHAPMQGKGVKDSLTEFP